jgi:hypothetical protein
MPVSYDGQSQRGIETYNFGGINRKATIVNLKDGEARDITNYDIDITGGIKRRAGYVQTSPVLSGVGAPDPKLFKVFYKQNGTEVFVAVEGHKFWESADTYTWTDRTGSQSITLTDNPHNGTDFNSKFYWGNGVDQPFVFTPGSSLTTLRSASLLSPPAAPSITPTGSSLTKQWQYVITTVAGQGESLPSTIGNIFSGPSTLTPTSSNTLSWVPVLGAIAYRIYRYNTTSNQFYLIAEVSGLASNYTDAGDVEDPFTPPPTVSMAYNTPSNWETDGAPEGFAVVSRGLDQRLLAWRKDLFWVSALNNGLDWFNVDGSPVQITGAIQNEIKAVVTLFDFTVFFTPTNSFFYSGSFPSTFRLNKMVGIGCRSPKSIITLADDVFLWSQHGPTSLSRIDIGADIKSTPMSVKVAPIVYGTNLDRWDLICAYLDLKNQRIVWSYPNAPGITVNNEQLVFQYTIRSPDGSIGAWSKYSGWPVVEALRSKDSDIHALFSDGSFNILSTGNTDNGTAIAAVYESAFFNLDTYRKKRLVWVDLLMDARVGTYNMGVTVTGDYGRTNEIASHTVTDTTTDGLTITTLGSFLNQHRLYTKGDSRAYQLTFSTTDSPNPPQIVGFRFEARFKGMR